MSTQHRPLDFIADIDRFREEVRNWLTEAVPHDWKQQMSGASEAEYIEFQKQWAQQLVNAGLATPHWPQQWGGADLPLEHQCILAEEIAHADAPDCMLFMISFYHMPATIYEHGTEQQRDLYMEGARKAEHIWCQGFSEPGAGSDLAALKTKAERKGDVYVVNGQKVWSSSGIYADYCLLLARTDSSPEKKHAGISFFVMDMKSPGITVRPISQITGEAEFAEIFLDNVEIPVSNLVGAEGDGWRVAQSTLAAERGLTVLSQSERLAHSFQQEAEAGRDTWMQDDQQRRHFGLLTARLRSIRFQIGQLHSDSTGAMASYIKLNYAQLLQDYTEFLMRLDGLDALTEQQPVLGGGYNTGLRVNDFLSSYAWTISGGTNEVMRNIIAERFLGLPRG